MWIEFGNDLPAKYPNPSMVVCAIFDEIARSSWQGWHAISGSQGVLKWLATCDLSVPGQAAVKRAFASISERAALSAALKGKIILIPGGGEIVRSDNGEWIVPVEVLAGVSFAKSVLLTENIRDGKVLLLASNHYRLANKIRSANFALQLHNGGGADIANCLEHEFKEKSFPIAVTDGDFDHPECGPSATSKKCDDLVASEVWISHHLSLPCREIENFIPINLVSDAIEADLPNSTELNEKNMKLNAIRALRSDVQIYADLKDGTKGFYVTSSESVISRRNYWAEVAKNVGLTCGVECENSCVEQSLSQCKCELVIGVGAIAPRVLDYCDKTSQHKQVERAKTSFNFFDWVTVGEAVFSWGVADLAMRT